RRSLDINVEQEIVSILAGFAQIPPRRAIAVPMYVGIFQELAAPNHIFEILHANKVILFSILLASARVASGVRDGKIKIGNELQQVAGESRFARAGRGRDDED